MLGQHLIETPDEVRDHGIDHVFDDTLILQCLGNIVETSQLEERFQRRPQRVKHFTRRQGLEPEKLLFTEKLRSPREPR